MPTSHLPLLEQQAQKTTLAALSLSLSLSLSDCVIELWYRIPYAICRLLVCIKKTLVLFVLREPLPSGVSASLKKEKEIRIKCSPNLQMRFVITSLYSSWKNVGPLC